MSTSLTARQGLGIATYDDMDRAMRVFCAGARMNPQETALKLAVGSGLGFTLAQCLSEIHIIEGRPSIGATLQLSIARGRGVRHDWIESTRTRATLRLHIPGEGAPRDTTWTIEMARESGLVREGKAGSNWSKFPDAMLRARCITTGIRMWCPEVLGMTLYDPDEIRDSGTVDHVSAVGAPARTVPGLAPAPQIEAPAPDVLDARVEPAPIEVPEWASGDVPLTMEQAEHVTSVLASRGIPLARVESRHGASHTWTGATAAAILTRAAAVVAERATRGGEE